LLHLTQKLQQERGRGEEKRKDISIFRYAAHKTKDSAGMRKDRRNRKGSMKAEG
jgi:hypothetical protein